MATLSPRAEVPKSVRKLPEPKRISRAVGILDLPVQSAPTPPAAAPAVVVSPASAEAGRPGGTLAAAACPMAGPVPLPQPRRSAEVTPLSPNRYRYQLTIGGSTLEKLRFVKDMLRHALPSGDDEAILDRALTALLSDLARRKFGAGRRTGLSVRETGVSRRAAPGSGPIGAADSRHVPVAVQRAVWVRDLGRCAFVGTDGRRCDERSFVEFHHVRPYAVGGEPSVENIELQAHLDVVPERAGSAEAQVLPSSLSSRAEAASGGSHFRWRNLSPFGSTSHGAVRGVALPRPGVVDSRQLESQ